MIGQDKGVYQRRNFASLVVVFDELVSVVFPHFVKKDNRNTKKDNRKSIRSPPAPNGGLGPTPVLY